MDKNGLFPIYGLEHVPFWKTKLFYYGLFFLGAVFISVVVWYLFKKYRSVKKEKRSAADIALKELAEIEKLVVDNKILGQTFYFRLTWIFKRYLHDHYGFDVYGKTDSELLLYLGSSGVDESLIHEIEIIFEGSSFIKFAKEQVVQVRMKKDLNNSIAFINKTSSPADKDGGS